MQSFGLFGHQATAGVVLRIIDGDAKLISANVLHSDPSPTREYFERIVSAPGQPIEARVYKQDDRWVPLYQSDIVARFLYRVPDDIQVVSSLRSPSTARDRWESEHTTKLTIKLNNNTDADILDQLEAAESKAGLIKKALRAYREETQAEQRGEKTLQDAIRARKDFFREEEGKK